MADDGKIPAMQTAAKNLVDQLSGLARTPGDIYISIIPFAKDVNGGASNYNQSWVDFTDWDAGPGNRQLWHMQPARSDLRCNIAPAARRTSSSLPRRARPPRCSVDRNIAVKTARLEIRTRIRIKKPGREAGLFLFQELNSEISAPQPG